MDVFMTHIIVLNLMHKTKMNASVCQILLNVPDRRPLQCPVLPCHQPAVGKVVCLNHQPLHHFTTQWQAVVVVMGLQASSVALELGNEKVVCNGNY